METIQLRNSILGWMLHPVSKDSVKVLTDLYLEDYDAMKPSQRAFMKGEPIDEVIAHIKDVCKDMKIGVSFCGKKGGPTIRLWPNKFIRVKPDEISVDLKWSCWSVDQSIWDEYAAGIWDRMKQAWKGTANSVVISTGPRKEIRYGSVLISKGQASGYFCTEWDSIESLADTLETDADEAFYEMIPMSIHNMEPGMDWDFSVKARSFAKLMERIDKEEDNLLETDAQEWKYISDCFRKT